MYNHNKLEQAYDIPYRCLWSIGVENLLIAGRCISGDSETHSSYRVQSHRIARGEAVGRAVALICRTGVSMRNIDVCKLQIILKKSGANI